MQAAVPAQPPLPEETSRFHIPRNSACTGTHLQFTGNLNTKGLTVAYPRFWTLRTLCLATVSALCWLQTTNESSFHAMSQTKFHTLIISATTEASKSYASELRTSPWAGSIDFSEDYPSDDSLLRTLRLGALGLLLIDCSQFSRALEIINLVRAQSPEIEIIAICQEDAKILGALLRSGVHNYLTPAAPVQLVRDIFVETIKKLSSRPAETRATGEILAFLPSKPGVGASTIAGHTALAASSDSSKRVLLADFDREAPMQAFLHRLRPNHFLQEALANSLHMDPSIWLRLVSQRTDLDILPADADGAPCSDTESNLRLLNFIRTAYDFTFVDLPGTLDPFSVDTLLQAKCVYLVCTQELDSIHIAIRKADRLRRLGLDKEIRLLLNRLDSSSVITSERLAGLIGAPIEFSFPNSYGLTTASLENGDPINASTPLGRSYHKFAQFLLNGQVKLPRQRKKFLQYFFQPFARLSPSSSS